MRHLSLLKSIFLGRGGTGLKFALALAAAIALMLAVRAWAFTIYRVTHNHLQPLLEQNDRVVVNKLISVPYHRGELVVFQADSAYIGRVEAVPGDTVLLNGSYFVLPMRCGCRECECIERSVYLINTGNYVATIPYADIIGRAYPLLK